MRLHSRNLSHTDFDVDGNLGRCRVCPGANWTSVRNLRAHEKLAQHQRFSKQALVLSSRYAAAQLTTAASTSLSSNPNQHATVEDYDSDEEFDDCLAGAASDLFNPVHSAFDTSVPLTYDNANWAETVATFRTELQHAQVSLAGYDNEPDEYALALEEALSGVALINAVLNPSDEEVPAALLEEDDEDLFQLHGPGECRILSNADVHSTRCL